MSGKSGALEPQGPEASSPDTIPRLDDMDVRMPLGMVSRSFSVRGKTPEDPAVCASQKNGYILSQFLRQFIPLHVHSGMGEPMGERVESANCLRAGPLSRDFRMGRQFSIMTGPHRSGRCEPARDSRTGRRCQRTGRSPAGTCCRPIVRPSRSDA